jgi:hypothetical protein
MGKYIAGMLLLTALVFVQPSKADSITTFELTGHGLDISLSLPTTLTPASVSSSGVLLFDNVAGTFHHGGTYIFSSVYIGPVGIDQFTNYWAFGSQTQFIEFEAPGLFTWNPDGTVTFNTGIFALGDYHVLTGGPHDYTLRVTQTTTDVPTPEPASLILLGAGALAVGAILRRKES